MSQMSQALQQKQQNQALQQGQQASSKLLSMLDQMQQAQMALNQDNTEKMKREIQLAIDHCTSLSEDQESRLLQTQAIDPQSAMMHDMAKAQKDLAESCSGLQKTVARLGKESPFIAAELHSLVNSAVQNMDMATTELSQKNAKGVKYQTEAMYLLNRASTRLMESLDQLNQCQNGASCSKPMAKLESLCNKQNQLNQQTQGMCNKPGEGGMKEGSQGEEYRAGLQRLAGEQGAIRKSLEQLQQEFGNSRQILGRLSDIADEMKDVEDALSEGQAGQETTERQLRIYSRMLEASRSLQRKDFTDQRRANTATESPVFIPQNIPSELLDNRIELEDRLRRFLGDNYPKQYEEQIKAYFRALLNVETSDQKSAPEVQEGQ
jgi:hypothetical protein